MQLFKTREDKLNRQSILSVYYQAITYFDQIYSYFAIIFQYFLFVYKYSILIYQQSTIAGQIILLTILLFLNALRLSLARTGNKGKKYLNLFISIILDILLVLGYIYIVALQINALLLQVVLSIIGLVFTGSSLFFAIVLIIMYRVYE